jgi:hypothetical protein
MRRNFGDGVALVSRLAASPRSSRPEIGGLGRPAREHERGGRKRPAAGTATQRRAVYSAAVLRSLRLIAIATVTVAMIGLGVVAGLFLVVNSGWIPVTIPPWLTALLGDRPHEVWLPALIAGWLISPVLLSALVLWGMFYLWRRRQYESLIDRLERELAKLRNLPFIEPAPLEDLPEAPNAYAARAMQARGDDGDEEP